MPHHLDHHHTPMDHSFSSSTFEDAEDNAFYAELTRQILLLTDEDDEVQVKSKSVRRFNQRWSLMPGAYFSWSEGEVSVPVWMERLWSTKVGGTGVFIPRGVVHRSKRRYNKPRKSNDRGRANPAPGHKNLGSS